MALISPLGSIYTLSIFERSSVKADSLKPCMISSSEINAFFRFSFINLSSLNSNILLPLTIFPKASLCEINQQKMRCIITMTKQVIITGTNADAPTIARLKIAPSNIEMILSSGLCMPNERLPDIRISKKAIKKNYYSSTAHLVSI